MSKPSRGELLETKGYLLGIAEGLKRAMNILNNEAGECYKRRDDERSNFYREAADALRKPAADAQELHDKEFPK